MNKLLYILIFLSLIFVSIILFVIYASNNNQTTTVTTSSPTPIQKDTTIASIAPSIKPTKIITPTPTKNTSTKLNWGAWVSWKVSEVNDFQTKVGKTMNYIVTFVHWGNENELPLDLGNLAKSKGQTLVLYWEVMNYNIDGPNDPRFSYDAILRGDWDSYLKDFASQAKSFGGQVILIPFEEMNGDWYPWSGTKNGNSAAKHILAYRYVKKFFIGINNVKFGWTVNNESSTSAAGNQIADYYPGDEYVDIVGINGFNFNNPWITWAQVFNSGLKQVEVYNKPILISSMACAPSDKKAEWITAGLGTEIYKHPKVIGWIWFNENKEKDWRVWSDTNSLAAFKSILP